MASYIVTVAEAIKTHVEGGVPYVINPVEIERRWLPYTDRVAIGTTTKIVIVPNDATQQAFSRSTRRNELVIDVFIQKAVHWETAAEGDAMCELGEQVNDRIDLLRATTYAGGTIARSAATFEPMVVGEHLTEYRLWTSRITTTWLMAQ